MPWRRKWQSTPVFLPGRAYGQRSLVGYDPWGCKSWTWFSDWKQYFKTSSSDWFLSFPSAKSHVTSLWSWEVCWWSGKDSGAWHTWVNFCDAPLTSCKTVGFCFTTFFFFLIYLCGCIGSQLPHVASSLWCKGFCLIVACGLLGSVLVMNWLRCPTRCGILVPWPGIEPMSPALEGEFSTREPPGKSPCFLSMTLTSHAQKRGSQHLCPRAGWGWNEVMKVLQPAQGQDMAAAYCPCVLSSCL